MSSNKKKNTNQVNKKDSDKTKNKTDLNEKKEVKDNVSNNKEKNIDKDTEKITKEKKEISVSKNTNNSKKEKVEEKNTNKSLNKKEKPNMDSKDTKNNESKENIVFKNSKSAKKEEQIENKTININKKNEEKKDLKDNKKKDETQEKRDNSKGKLIIISLITVLLVCLLIFSVIFSIIHATKDTIARGVSIRNIDISNLTYNEAKSKLEEAFNVAINVNINLKYEDFSYVIAGDDINLSYDLSEALNEAYNIGRSGNIIQNNYSLISTALLNKEIDVQFTYDEDALNTIIEYVSTNVPNLVKQYSYYIEDTNLIIVPGSDGIEVDKDELKNLIISKIQNRNLVELLNESIDDEIEIPYNEVIADSIDIESIYNDVKTEPQDAYYVEATETTEFEIHSDVDGIDFAITLDEAKAIVSEEGKEQYTIPLTITEANITINDIGIDAFPYTVSTFQTTYDASNTSRSENLRIAASKINGTVLMPGEQFSFNEVVGERTVSEGYQDAKIYSNGQVVDGLAGGICQISSTIYNAALLANLQIDERYNHSFTTSYVKAGRDATVVYGIKDLKFTNTRTYPIKIEASVSNGICTFTIYGIEQENEYEVKIIPVTTSTTPYTTQTITDSSLASGTTVVSQSGANGCTVTTYKEVYLNGVQISREAISSDTYQVMTRIIRVGPTTDTETSTE